MTLEEHIQYWLKSAAHDLETAETLFNNNRYDWSLFLGHLVIEKLLKAHFVRDNRNKVPPFTHNLSAIANKTKLKLSVEQETLLLEINQFNIRTRYPDYKFGFYKKCTPEFTQDYFSKIKGLYQWLFQQI